MNKTIRIAILTAAALATPSALACHYCSGIITPNDNDVPLARLNFLYIGTTGRLQETDENGWTMLHWAVEAAAESQTELKPLAFEAHRENLLRATRIYLQKRADPNIKNNAGETALMRAVFYNDAEMVNILLGNAPLTADDFTIGEARDRFNDYEQTWRNISPPIDSNPNRVNNNGDTALMYAARYADYAIVENLINHGANVNDTDNDDNNALFHLAQRSLGRLSVLSHDFNIGFSLVTLVQNISATNNNGENILEHAINHNNINLLDNLLTHHEDNPIFNSQNDEGNTPLMLAAQLGRTEMVGLMINRTDISVNVVNNNSRNAFIEAAYFGHVDIMKQLYALDSFNTVNLNYRDNTGATPLLAAVAQGNYAAVKYLLEIGADPNSRQCAVFIFTVCIGTGNTPLLYAVKNRDNRSTRDLILEDANLDLANEDGITPLILAASLGYPIYVSSLLHHGADPFIGDDNDLSALAHAGSQNTDKHREIVDLLLRHIRGSQ